MQLLRLTSYPIEQIVDLEALERKNGDWFAARTYPVRLLAFSQRFDIRPATTRILREARQLDRLRRFADPLLSSIAALLSGDGAAAPWTSIADLPAADAAMLLDLFGDVPELVQTLTTPSRDPLVWATIADGLASLLWRSPWLKEQLRFYERLGQAHLRSSTYVLLTWEPSDLSGGAIGATLRHVTGRTVQTIDHLPGVLQGRYRERTSYLEPEQSGQPYLAGLLAYDMRGEWDATTLHSLLSVPFDVALAVDIETQDRNKAMRTAELAYSTARVLVRDPQTVDVRAQRIEGDAQLVMHELVRQSLHMVQVAVLVSGATLEALEQHLAELSGRLGTRIRFMRANGWHGELLKLWSTESARQIDIPWRRRVMLSHGVGCLFGVLGFHRAGATDGFLWGMDAVRRAPLFVDMFRDNQAGHTLVLGKTGYGKTVFLNVLALRGAIEAGYRVIGIDAFRNGERVEVAAGAGGHCYLLGLHTSINLLDIVYDQDTEGGWLPGQVQHVIGQLALLLGTPGTSADGKDRLVPRALSVAERGILDRALMHVYATSDPTQPLTTMPRLIDLITALEALREVEGRSLARDLRLLLFGTDDSTNLVMTTLGSCFNQHTAVDWNFTRDITYYDFSRVPEMLRPFFYAQAIGAVLRFMRDPHRDRTRKTLLQIDEFGYLMQVEALAHLAATICKVARKYAMALVAVDQNPDTFFGSEAGRRIAENCTTKVLFHLDDHPARQMGAAIADLTPGHVRFLSEAGKGECVMVVGNDVYIALVELTPRELRVLSGS